MELQDQMAIFYSQGKAAGGEDPKDEVSCCVWQSRKVKGAVAHVTDVLNELPAVISSSFSQAWDRLCESHPSTWSTDVAYTGNARVEQKDILSRGLDLVFRWIAWPLRVALATSCELTLSSTAGAENLEKYWLEH